MSTNNTDTGDTSLATRASTINAGPGITSDSITTIESITVPREALITTAVNFLQNAKVRHTTLMQKQQFLKSKGLTMDEIQLACERAGVFSQDPNNPTVINMGITTHAPMPLQASHQTAFGKIREILHSMALLSGVAYAIYIFWKKYIEPFLFGKKKKKSIDEALEGIEEKVDTSIHDVQRELTDMKSTLTQQQREQAQQINREFNNFRSDLEAIKGLLLNRKQFATPINTGPASIPAWQLSSSPHHTHHHGPPYDTEKGDDAGSGSGSSETEVVTKNSDSSLEIM